MKILFVAWSLDRAGAERQLLTLAGALSERGHEVVVATFRPGDFDAELERSGARLVSLRVPTRWSIPMATVRLARLARSLRPDIIHGYLDAPDLLASLIAPIARPARAVWGVQGSAVAKNDLPVHSRALYWMEPRVARTADLIIFNAEVGRRDAVDRGFPPDHLLVVPQGVDTARFRPDPDAGRQYRERLGVDPGAIVIGRVGRLHPMKDWESFIDALGILDRRGCQVHALAVGAGDADYAQELRVRAERTGVATAMTWCEPSDDVVGMYAACDLHVSSSSYGEGLPNVVVEAMACELPSVVTDVGDSARAVGDTGTVVAPRDAKLLADAIDAMLAQPPAARRELGARARARVIEMFSIEQFCEQTLVALESVVAPSTRV